MTRWRELFPDFDVPPVFEVALQDRSEANDACPKFELELKDFVVTIYVDHPIYQLRETADRRRFQVTISFYDNINEMGSVYLLKTEDQPEVISLLSMIKEANQ